MWQLSQEDLRWKNSRLGTSRYTIGQYGCVVTCLGMLANKYPTEVNDILNKNNGFLNGLLVIWGNATRALNLPYNPTQNKAVSYPCIGETKLSNGLQHFFVILNGVDIIDPLDGRQKRNPYRIVSYRNIGPATTAPEPTPTPPAPTPTPGPTWPRGVTVVEPANVRSQPRLNAPLSGSRTLRAGDVFVGVELVDGDSVRGNNKWVKSSKGNYVHTINLRY